MVGYVQNTYFNPNGFMFKKDLPPIALLAKKILEEKENQTASLSLIRFNEKAKKKKEMIH